MVEMTASVDGAASRAFDAAFKEFAASLGDGIAKAPQRAAISICKSFRAASATAKSPKYARSSEYLITKSDSRPKYITAKDGTKLRRWKLDRSAVSRGVYDVYAVSKPDVRRHRLLLVRAGLARQSWGWVMHNIFTGAAPDTPWRRRKNDRRNPKDATKESYSQATPSALHPSGVARICNRIDYIGDALKISVDAVLMKAANRIIRPIINAKLRAGGVSADEIKAAGSAAHKEWLSQFSAP